MAASAVYIATLAGFAASLSIPDMPADTVPLQGEFEVAVPLEGEFEVPVEEVAHQKGSVTVGASGIVRTVDQAEHVELKASSKSASCKWMIAVLPPLVLLAFVMLIRNEADKARHKDSNASWFSTFLRMNLIQQALAVAAPEKESSGAEDQAEMGKSLLSRVEEDEDGGCCPDSGTTAATSLLQSIPEDSELQEEEEDPVDESAKLFASLAESLYQDGMTDDDFHVL
eukprot:gnl/MRDRNA2_/MRDRNA2_132116_c0_seq1.p1 gnl/MRDRNA2_/MRDRNA2_132116_c0~~gnl/MRDRNA2_/MRDRNA2_132116_c0_seq1.p1  ORF type:complete len:227 (+),score=60.72 gnl/MRDRNA2_/MRDRNA2_132116_c0_seq1:98-778(+)